MQMETLGIPDAADARPFHFGKRVDAGPCSVPSINPTTGAQVAKLADGGAEAVARSVEAARLAFDDGRWSARSVADRQSVLFALADGLVAASQELAALDCAEMGIPITEALADVAVTADHVRAIATLLPALTGGADTPAANTLAMNIFEPHGVVAAITPWNFPLNQAVVKVAPALAMGNSVVLKPSEIASLSALRLADLAADAGLPAGVLEVVTGHGRTTGAALARHPGVDHLTFTGSPETGARIQSEAPRARSAAMELGGKSPMIVCESVQDAAALAPAIARSAFWNSGQVCTAGSRLLVHRRHASAVVEALLAECAHWLPSDPTDPASVAGPLATAAQHASVLDHVKRALAQGGRCITDTLPVKGLALGVRPTLFDRVTPDQAIACEEVFGPVLAISQFETRAEATALANASGYGLSATVWTADFAEARHFARTLRAGVVTIATGASQFPAHAPALGLEPQGRSGFGADFGLAGLRQYGRLKLVTFATD
jgi:acyl-CoA reductase-like NAD-dependent aldehyde dehydrogenase